MTRRTYGQFCAVAKALDVVGERWTLLVIRELLLGPRRFTDLLTVLPGLGTNLLADRLKQLETAGIVTRDRLPPPAASAVYRLTEVGQGLGPVVRALADWGDRLLQAPSHEEAVQPEWLALHRSVLATVPPKVRETYELHVAGDVLHIQVTGGRASARLGPAPGPPDAVIRTDRAAFLDLALGQVGLPALATAGRVEVEGSAAALAHLAQILTPRQEDSR
jgi:DNA-binding HxlR family transcriptional regulator